MASIGFNPDGRSEECGSWGSAPLETVVTGGLMPSTLVTRLVLQKADTWVERRVLVLATHGNSREVATRDTCLNPIVGPRVARPLTVLEGD